MKRNWILSGLISLLIAGAAYGSPNYDSKDWQAFMEGKTATMPSGIPTGKGSVNAWNGADFWRARNMLGIQDAIDASGTNGIALSGIAKNAKRTYTSQTGIDFLEATVAEMRRISGDNTIQLPVSYLGYQGTEVPMISEQNLPMDIALGLFVSDNGKSVALADSSYAFGQASEGLILPKDQVYQAYTKIINGKKAGLQSMDMRMLNAKLHEYRSNAMTEGRKNFKLTNATTALKKQVISDFGDSLDELSQEEREFRISEEALRRQMASQQGSKSSKPKIYTLDEKNTWLMIEAALSQKTVPISSITCPPDLRVKMIQYASANKRPQNIINKFAELSHGQVLDVHIVFTPSCSVRDRFLGCPFTDPETDKVVNSRAKTMLAASHYLSNDQLIQVLKMIFMSGADQIYDELKELLNQTDKNDKDVRSMISLVANRQRIKVEELPNITERNDGLDDKGNSRLLAPLMGLLLTPDSVRQLPSVLQNMEEHERQWLLRSYHIRRSLQASDNPDVARFLLEFYTELDLNRNPAQLQENIIQSMNEMLADLLVYEIPDNLTSESIAIGYWQNIGVQTAGKSKETLIKEALSRANIRLPNAKLESVENIDIIAANMETMIQKTPVLAANLHRVAERTLNVQIPMSKIRKLPGKSQYQNRFEHWWAENKVLYASVRLVTHTNYDRYESYYGHREIEDMPELPVRAVQKPQNPNIPKAPQKIGATKPASNGSNDGKKGDKPKLQGNRKL